MLLRRLLGVITCLIKLCFTLFQLVFVRTSRHYNIVAAQGTNCALIFAEFNFHKIFIFSPSSFDEAFPPRGRVPTLPRSRSNSSENRHPSLGTDLHPSDKKLGDSLISHATRQRCAPCHGGALARSAGAGRARSPSEPRGSLMAWMRVYCTKLPQHVPMPQPCHAARSESTPYLHTRQCRNFATAVDENAQNPKL
jgi:hypothetical protein